MTGAVLLRTVCQIAGSLFGIVPKSVTSRILFELNKILKKEAVAYIIGDMSFVLVSNDGDLFNPFNSSANRNKKDLEKGGLFYNLKRCQKTCFDYYIMFLRTKNGTHYTLAQRSFLK